MAREASVSWRARTAGAAGDAVVGVKCCKVKERQWQKRGWSGGREDGRYTEAAKGGEICIISVMLKMRVA